MKKIILASASPRRIEMLKKAGCDPQVVPASIIEELPCPMSAEDATVYLARQKAQAVLERIRHDQKADDELVIIAADTVVVDDGNIIGKPADEKQAYEILSRLRGRSHHVITGCCIMHSYIGADKEDRTDSFYEDTSVFFKDYSDEELRAYVATDEPYDKAGGYAIQGTFGKYIDHFEGDYDNVVGLPLTRVLELI